MKPLTLHQSMLQSIMKRLIMPLQCIMKLLIMPLLCITLHPRTNLLQCTRLQFTTKPLMRLPFINQPQLTTRLQCITQPQFTSQLPSTKQPPLITRNIWLLLRLSPHSPLQLQRRKPSTMRSHHTIRINHTRTTTKTQVTTT